MTSKPVREAVGVPPEERSLQAAVDEPPISGFDGPDIGVVAGRRSPERKFGALCDALYDDVADLDDAPEAPFAASVESDSRTQANAAVGDGLARLSAIGVAGAEISYDGTVAVAAERAARAGGVGTLVGCALSLVLDRHPVLDRHRADCVNRRIARGGLPWWMQPGDRDREARTCRVLRREAARNSRVNDVVHAGPEFVGGVSFGMSLVNKLRPYTQ